MKYKIAPSMMCVDIFNISETVLVFEKTGIEYLHIDIMDGQFVPNYALGTDFVKRLHAGTNIPLDIHLMVTNPEQKIDYFDIKEGDIVSFHIETTAHAQRLVTAIKQSLIFNNVRFNKSTLKVRVNFSRRLWGFSPFRNSPSAGFRFPCRKITY